MESGRPPEEWMAHYLVMDYTDEKQKNIADSLQMLVDKKELSKDQLSAILLYIRELNMELKFPSHNKEN